MDQISTKPSPRSSRTAQSPRPDGQVLSQTRANPVIRSHRFVSRKFHIRWQTRLRPRTRGCPRMGSEDCSSRTSQPYTIFISLSLSLLVSAQSHPHPSNSHHHEHPLLALSPDRFPCGIRLPTPHPSPPSLPAHLRPVQTHPSSQSVTTMAPSESGPSQPLPLRPASNGRRPSSFASMAIRSPSPPSHGNRMGQDSSVEELKERSSSGTSEKREES